MRTALHISVRSLCVSVPLPGRLCGARMPRPPARPGGAVRVRPEPPALWRSTGVPWLGYAGCMLYVGIMAAGLGELCALYKGRVCRSHQWNQGQKGGCVCNIFLSGIYIYIYTISSYQVCALSLKARHAFEAWATRRCLLWATSSSCRPWPNQASPSPPGATHHTQAACLHVLLQCLPCRHPCRPSHCLLIHSSMYCSRVAAESHSYGLYQKPSSPGS